MIEAAQGLTQTVWMDGCSSRWVRKSFGRLEVFTKWVSKWFEQLDIFIEWVSKSFEWMDVFTKRVSKSFKWLDVNFYCTGNQGIRTDANFFDHMTQVIWTNANFFQTASEWNFVWKWKAVDVCFCVKGHKFCRTIVTSHVKTDTNGYQFEWLKTVCLLFALHFLIVICSWWMWCCSNRFGHPFRKISTCLNGCCYPFK